MSPLRRFGRFTLVGAMGMVVQLTTVAILHRLAPHHGLLVSATALELTLLHNFTWHLRYTWRNRRGSRLRKFLRFHLTNGLLSMLGSLAIVCLMVHAAHLNLLLANILAVAVCSLGNFCVANLWVFEKAATMPTTACACDTFNPCASLLPSSQHSPRLRLRSPHRP